MEDSNKKVQKLTLNTLKVFIDFCDKHQLRYYFTGGALIGALRHKGFIPWDDDIDLGLRSLEKTKNRILPLHCSGACF